MTFQSKLKILATALFALGLSPTCFADPVSGCANNPGSPVNISGTLYTTYTCNLYNTGGNYTINMTPVLTSGGATLTANAVGAGYLVVINGNPATLADNLTGLFNESLWDAVLYFPGDFASGTESDMLTVDWPGFFPSASLVQTTDQSLYPTLPDQAFFVRATGSETMIGLVDQQYNVFTDPPATAPEPSSFWLLFSGMLGLAFLGVRRMYQPLSQGLSKASAGY